MECLADLEKAIRSNSTPEQLIGSLATRTLESQSYPNVHHATIRRMVHPPKGRWLRFSEEQIQRIREHEKNKI